MNIIEKRIDDLIMYENNPKIHTDEQIDKIAKSIELTKGLRQPIVIDKNNVIVVGHGRVQAAMQLGLETVPCELADDLTEEEIRAYRLIDNELAKGESDLDLLEQELASFNDIDMSEFGFDISEDENDAKEVIEDDYEEQLPVEPKSKLGDIYKLGRHRLMCGDSTDVENVKKLTGGVEVDLFLTDPPYNVAYEGKTEDHLTIQNDSLDDVKFREFLKSAFMAANEVMKNGAAFYIWHADSEGYNFRGACKDIGWKVRECLIWNKNSMVLGRQDYQWKHEPCLYGWKDGAGHIWTSDRKQTTVIDFPRPTKADIHPTMKPVGLFDYLIKNNTHSGDVVLDLFNGSGTTIMACEQNNRNAYVMELDPRYVDAAIERWENFTGLKAELIKE